MLSKELEYITEIPEGSKFTSVIFSIKELVDGNLIIAFEDNCEDKVISETITLPETDTVEDLIRKMCSSCELSYEFIEPNILKIKKTC